MLTALVYAALLAINWSDRPPSETALRFAELYESRPAVLDSENAYTFMLGFSAAPGVDPREIGARRQAWIRSVAGELVPSTEDPLAEYDHFPEERPDDLTRLCRVNFGTECLDALSDPDAAASQWIESERWLLDRYLELISLTGYREPRHGINTPQPGYSLVLAGQRLLFASIWIAAQSGDIQSADNMLQDDLAFWRRTAANADTLLSKMIHVAAVIQHFEMGNSLFRRAQRDGVDITLPPAWLEEMSGAERSMRRALAGEWAYANRIISNPDFVGEALLAPFWQPQDVSNRRADVMSSLADMAELPYDELAEVYSRPQPSGPSSRGYFDFAYNFVGKALAGTTGVDRHYVGRAADLEGVRRAAIVAWQLRDEGTEASEVESRLAESDWRNPYTGAPFEWDDAAAEIVFVGLRPRGPYRFPY